MKTTDLFESFTTNINQELLKNKGDYIASGTFADVFSSKDPDQTAIKQIRDGFYDPAFNYWVNEIVKNNLRQKNPTFPRFYNIKLENNKVIGAEMEKLTELRLLSDEQKEQLFVYIFGISRNDYHVPLDRFIEDLLPKMIVQQINKGVSSIKNQNIKNACKIVNKLLMRLGEFEVGLDLHVENMMARIYKYGVQLVVADPFVM